MREHSKEELAQNHFNVKNMMKYFKFYGIVETQDHIGEWSSYEKSKTHKDEFDWQEYEFTVEQDENGSEINFEMKDVVVMGNENHEAVLDEVVSRF